MNGIAPPVAANGREKAAVPSDLIWRLSVEQYHQMIQAGILTNEDPVELLEGWLAFKTSKNPPHSLATRLTRQVLEKLVQAGWFVDAQEPLTTDDSEPEPDVKVVRGEVRQYGTRHPQPQDLALVVEVADSSLARDRGWKKRIYARAAVPVYWIVNLQERQIEVYADPTGPADEPDYRQRRDYTVGDRAPVVVDGQEIGSIAVNDLLP